MVTLKALIALEASLTPIDIQIIQYFEWYIDDYLKVPFPWGDYIMFWKPIKIEEPSARERYVAGIYAKTGELIYMVDGEKRFFKRRLASVSLLTKTRICIVLAGEEFTKHETASEACKYFNSVNIKYLTTTGLPGND